MKKQYYIGVLTNKGEVRFVYSIEDEYMYWETYPTMIKNNHTPMKFTTRKLAEDYVKGLIINGNLAFVIESYFDLVKDIRIS